MVQQRCHQVFDFGVADRLAPLRLQHLLQLGHDCLDKTADANAYETKERERECVCVCVLGRGRAKGDDVVSMICVCGDGGDHARKRPRNWLCAPCWCRPATARACCSRCSGRWRRYDQRTSNAWMLVANARAGHYSSRPLASVLGAANPTRRCSAAATDQTSREASFARLRPRRSSRRRVAPSAQGTGQCWRRPDAWSLAAHFGHGR